MKPQARALLAIVAVVLMTGAILMKTYSEPPTYPVAIRFPVRQTTVREVEESVAAPEESAAPEIEQAADPGPTERVIYFPLDLNSATREELTCIPGVGEVLSSRIVQYREVLGGYNDLEQLMEIKGIGAETCRAISAYLIISE